MAGDEPNAFGREVRRRRLAQGLTLDALSAVADLTANYIGSIEAGQRDPTRPLASSSPSLRVAGLRWLAWASSLSSAYVAAG